MNTSFEIQYQKLNPSQQKAVDTIYGPVMVVAGPGTGKTQIIGLRTANIIKQTGVNPGNILITTFTEAGVIAIKKRLETFLGSQGYKVVVSTIHSFCQDVIKNFPELFLQYKAGTPIDDVETLEVLKGLLDTGIAEKKIEVLTSDYEKYFYLRDIKSRISTLKQEGVSPDAFLSVIQQQVLTYQEELSLIKPTLKKYEKTKLDQEKHIKKLEELQYIYLSFQKYLQEKSYYDFNDMIQYVLREFENNVDLALFYAEKFQFIMLDEYQDTNNAQNKIIDLILRQSSDDKPNILVVGDDDQSIYRFQGANIENMLDFVFKYKDIETVVLENNYRSSQDILDLCSASISFNEERLSKRVESINKKLISSHPKFADFHQKPSLFTPNSKEEETSYLLERVQKYLEEGISPEEIAIITRNNKEVEEYSQFFIQNGVGVVSKLNTDILKNEYVLFVLKYFHCLVNVSMNEEYFIDIMRSSLSKVPQSDVFRLNKDVFSINYTKKHKITVFERLLHIEDALIDGLDKNALILFRDTFLDLQKELSEKNFMEFFKNFIERIGIIEYIEKNGSFDDIEDIYTLFNKIKSFFEIDRLFSLQKFLKKIELYQTYNYPIARQILKKQKSGIQILTAHSSKGLEYEVVFVPGLYHGNWDNKKVIDRLKFPNGIAGKGLQNAVDPIEEERRLFFVACSRAKKFLHLSFPLAIEGKIKLASSFLPEIQGWYEEENYKIDEKEFQAGIISQLKPKLVSYKQAEFDYIEEFLENYKLSPTDLNVFLEDPMQFLRSVVFKYPFIDNDATTFGKVYHRVLELFYGRLKQTGKLDDVGYLTFTFKTLLEKEVLTPESYEKLLEKGIAGLTGFYDLYKSAQKKILFLEYNFRPKGLSYKGVPITGKIDKIEGGSDTLSANNSSDGLGQIALFREKVHIIDYKTGRVKSLGEIKGLDRDGNKKPNEGKYFRQLMFYKLLCEGDYEFSSQFEIGSLALDFVEGRDGEYKYIEIPYTKEEYQYFLEELTQAWEKISNINFWKELLGEK